MIWLTWRQARGQAVTAAAALAVFAVLLAATGPHLASLYAASRITGCHGGTPCDTAASHFLSRLAGTSPYPIVYLLGIALILAAPAIIGIFWGAPPMPGPAWPAGASGKPSPTSLPAATGPSSGSRPRSSWPSP
jgi:hypothetical protein